MLGETANICQIWNRYKKVAFLGEGVYGKVTKAVMIKTKRIVAIKETNSDRDGILQTTLRELGIMARLKHRNVVQLRCWPYHRLIEGEQCQETNKVFIVMEYCQQDLGDFLNLNFEVLVKDQQMIQGFVNDMLQGIRELHKYGMIHRDLKPKNILVANCEGGKKLLKIADFGMGRSIIHGSLVVATPDTQTMLYRAPEVFAHVPRYHASVDIWSIACIWTEMHRGRHLINGTREIELFRFIFATLGQPTEAEWDAIGGEGDCPASDNQEVDLEDLIPGLNKEGIDLISKMFNYNPTLRITAADALLHPYFCNYQPDLDLKVIEERME